MPRGRILVADDNPDILRLVEVNLKFEDYETLTARNGEEALALARRETPDLIILDVWMGKLDGWQVLGFLKDDPCTHSIPVIIMTGSSFREHQQRERVQDVAGYLPKPFHPLRLIELVTELVPGPSVAPPQSETATADVRARVVLVTGTEGGAALLQNLLGNPAVEIVGVVGHPHDDGVTLARELALPVFSDFARLDAATQADVYIDAHGSGNALLRERAAREGAEVLSGRSLSLLQQVLAARDAGHLKERDLIRALQDRIDELSVVNDMAQLMVSPCEPADLYERSLHLLLRITRLQGGCVLLYDERQERFMPRARVGLSARFESKAALALSDPMVDEVLTLRRPLVVSDIDTTWRSGLMAAAAHEPLASMVCLPLMVKDKVVGLLVVGTRTRLAFSEADVALLSGLAAQLAVAIENVGLQRAGTEKQALIERLLGKVIQGQEDERKRLASEIHDGVAQSLAGMLSHVQVCQTLLNSGDTGKVRQELTAIRTIIADSVREVRQIIFDLRPSSLDDLGLLASLENFIKRYSRDTGIAVSFDTQAMPVQRLPSTLETTIFRIVQESLTNIKKHAQARTVRIRLGADAHGCTLRLSDDGVGFEVSEATEKFHRGVSQGVEGMRERISLLGGTFRIQSAAGKGTQILVDIPIPRAVDDSERAKHRQDRIVMVASSSETALRAVGNALTRLGEQALDDSAPA